MNDDQRDREAREAVAPLDDPLFAQRPGGASGLRRDAAERAGDKSEGEIGDEGETGDAGAPPLDDDAIAKHRAAKMARIRRRQAENRRLQEAAEGLRPDHAPVPSQEKRPAQRGTALPVLRPDVRADTPALRAERVEAIRRDLVRRRRRKGAALLVRMWLFVALPTTLVAWFLWSEASDLYRSEASFVVQSAEGAGAVGGAGFLGALMGAGGGVYDPVAVQTYILSRDVLRRLDAEHGWIGHFQSPDLDILHRLDPGSSFEDAFDHYQDMVSVSFDPTEGLIEMSVIAADPASARRFSDAIIGYSEQMVDELSNRIRVDAISDAERNMADAEARLREAQSAEAELRKALETFSVEGEFSAEMGIVAGMETELEAMRGRLAGLRRVTSGADPRVRRLQEQVQDLTGQIEQRRGRVTGGGRAEGQGSLADINAELARAQLDVQAGMAIFTAALQAREIARAEAARQHRYVSVVSQPSLPDEPNYPQKWQVTALAFLSFLGAYIVLSLTASLIREQASI